jgi:hypothetical protein
VGKTTTYTTVAGLNKTLRAIPKAATKELRIESQAIAGDVAEKAARRGRSLGGVAKYVPFKGLRDRVPVVRMGGSTRLPPRDGRPRAGDKQTVGNVMWGAEWGSHRYAQFEKPVKRGRMLWSTVDEMSDEMMRRWGDALGDALRKAR